MADDWDDSDEDDVPVQKKPVVPQQFDDDESDDDAPAAPDASNPPASSNNNNKNNDVGDSKNQTTPASNAPASSDKSAKAANAANAANNKKAPNNTNKQNNNASNTSNRGGKARKKPPAKQVSQPSKKNAKGKNADDSDSSTTSDDSDDEPQTKQKMPSYDDRYSEDNAILFGAKGRGGGAAGAGGGRGGGRGGARGGGPGRGQGVDERPMLSGDVRLQSFPLGSQADCIKLAKEVSALMNGKRYETKINSMDIIKFVTYVIDGLVSKNADHMDIVDINELKVQIDKIYNKKQKDMRSHKKKKKPIHKFGKTYATGPGGNYGSEAPPQGGKHVDGQYNANDFDFLN